MTLVVVGKEPLDTLQKWTEGRFKGVSEGREGGREGGKKHHYVKILVVRHSKYSFSPPSLPCSLPLSSCPGAHPSQRPLLRPRALALPLLLFLLRFLPPYPLPSLHLWEGPACGACAAIAEVVVDVGGPFRGKEGGGREGGREGAKEGEKNVLSQLPFTLSPFLPCSLPQNDASHRQARLDKPEYYVSHLLGHEGEGSLLSYLKREGLANALGAGREGGREGGRE